MQYYGPELEQRLRPHLKPTNKSWRVDGTYIRVKGRRATCIEPSIPRVPPSIFLLSAFHDADAAKRLFRKALGDRSHRQPRVINTDLAPIYTCAIAAANVKGWESGSKTSRLFGRSTITIKVAHNAVPADVSANVWKRSNDVGSKPLRAHLLLRKKNPETPHSHLTSKY